MADDGGGVATVVMDCGTSAIKAGFGGEEAPRVTVPTVLGRPRHPGVTGTLLGHWNDNFVGYDAVENGGLLNLHNPMKHGHVVDWLAMEDVWHASFQSALQVPCEEHPLLITEAPDNTRLDREKLAQTMFEVFNVPALVIGNTSVLTLYSTGRTTGLVVDSGASKTHIGPVWEGYSTPHYLRKINFGGDALTDVLQTRLHQQGYPFSTKEDRAHVENIKHEYCYACMNSEKELKYSKESHSLEKFYQLPDGTDVFLNETRFMTPEVLFQPNLLPQDQSSSQAWSEVIAESISCCEPSIVPEMYGSIVLGGGNTLFPHLDERIQKDASVHSPKGVVAKCVAFANRQYAAWVGGSILGSLSTFPSMWVSKSEYDDYGSSIIHRKC